MKPDKTAAAVTQSTAWRLPLLVAALTFAVFLPALNNGFLNWDDLQNLTENPHYRGLGPEQLKWMFTTSYLGPYQPLSWMTLGLDYLAWGMDPFGYHLTNVLLHSLNALLCYLLCVKLFTPAGGTETADLRLSAGFAALFFALHPLRVESVAWVTERRDVLCGTFYLLALLSYLSTRPAEGEPSPWRRRLLPLAAFFLALLSKGMAVSLPLVLVLLDIYPLKRLPGGPARWFSRETREIWLEKIPFFALAAVFGALGYAFQAQANALSSYQAFGFSQRAAQVLFAVVFYIRKTLLPLELSPFYKLPDGFGLLNWQSLLAGCAVAAITAAAIALRRSRPAVPAVWSFYLAALSPVAGFVKLGVQSAADRYTYIPCLGFAVLAGAGLRACWRAAGGRRRNSCALLACLILSGLAALTWRQQGIWRDSETLWRHTLALDPELDFPNYNLALALDAQGRTGEAEKYYREALRFKPGFPQAHYNLGLLLAARGETEEAMLHYSAAIDSDPGHAQAHAKLGAALAARGRTGEAVSHYLAALRIDPAYAQAHNNLGLLLAGQGKTDAAIMHYRAALAANPGYAYAHNNLGLILAAQGKFDEAAGHYAEALRLNPDNAQAHYNFGLLLAARGQAGEAAMHYRAAARLNPAISAPVTVIQGK
ncbi:MAG TPA: tetratricopeptide repeat protein [Elusimicrobiales bacterium]|nr:tetratricopeptide repeat protein [Elusimicrobiales bacterium]